MHDIIQNLEDYDLRESINIDHEIKNVKRDKDLILNPSKQLCYGNNGFKPTAKFYEK